MSESETERTAVRTYVPAYQCEEWETAAEELGMSRSEFVRTMVQVGRREFDVPARDGEPADTENPDETGATPGVDGLETRILGVLRDGPHSWEALLEELTAGLEDHADDCLQELQEDGRVRYSGRDGGYVLTDE